MNSVVVIAIAILFLIGMVTAYALGRSDGEHQRKRLENMNEWDQLVPDEEGE